MKILLTFATIVTFLSLGAAQAQTTSPGSIGPKLGTVGAVYSFSVDKRIADGNFVNMTFFSPNGYKFTVVKTEISARGGHKNSQTLATDIACRVRYSGSHVKTIVCSEDSRPVDGVLKVIAIVPSQFGTGVRYDAKYFVKYYDRINGKEVKKSKVLATELKRVN